MTGVPASDPKRESIRSELDRLWAAIRTLEQPNHAATPPRFIEREITFSTNGPPVVNTQSGPYHVRWPEATITEIRLASVQPVNQRSALVLYVNGSAEAELIHFPDAGDDSQHAVADDLHIGIEEWDRVAVGFTEIAAGLSNVTVQVIVMIPE